MITPGTHKARATKSVLTKSSKGTPCMQVEFELIDLGEHITWWGYFATSKNQEMTLKQLRHCGWSNDDLQAAEGIGDALVDLVIKKETYEGEEKLKVAWVNKPGGGSGVSFDSQMSGGEAQAFANKIKGLAIKSREHAVETPDPEATADDDIPF